MVRRRYFWHSNKEIFIMKTLKRIAAVLMLLMAILTISYFVYTARQIPPENIVSEVLYEVAKTT